MIYISGQEIEETEAGNIKLHIREIYISAGKKYHFPLNSPGISINESIVTYAYDNDKIIFLTMEDSPIIYWIRAKEIVDIVKEYDSIEERKGVRLFCVPIRALKRVN